MSNDRAAQVFHNEHSPNFIIVVCEEGGEKIEYRVFSDLERATEHASKWVNHNEKQD